MIASREFAEFNGLLAQAVERGVPLVGAFELLAAQARGREFRRALEEASGALREGASLPDALARGPFPEDYVALVRAGIDGKGFAGLLRAAEAYYGLLTRSARVVRRFVLYLAVVGAFAAVALAGLLFIGNRFGEVYETVKVPLPWITRATVWVTTHPFWSLLVFSIVAVPGWKLLGLLRRSPVLTALLYHVPGWGPVWKSRDLALLCTILAIRLRAGTALPDSLDAAAKALPNARSRAYVLEVRGRVLEGESFSSALFYRIFFPRTLAWAVSLAEARGDLPETLETFGRLYSSDLERSFEAFYALLTPLGILLLGNLAGFFAVAFLFPILSIMDGLSGWTIRGRGAGPDPSLHALFWLAGLDAAFLGAIVFSYFLVGRRRARLQLFVEHLAALASRSMPLASGLRMLGRDLGEVFGLRLERVARQLDDGRSLSEALAAVPEAIPPFPRAMIALGERSGNLAAFLDETRRGYRRLLDASRASAYVLLYPLFLSLVLNLALGFLALTVRPKMEEIFEQVKVPPPPEWGWPAVIAGNQAMMIITIGVALFVFMGGASPHFGLPLLTSCKGRLDRLLVRIPLLGRLVRQGSTSRLALSIGLFARAGAALPEAMGAAAGAEPNAFLRRGYEEVARDVADGRRLSEAARRSRLFPDDFLWFAEAGETAGTLPDTLLTAAAHYDTKARFLARVAARSLIPLFSILNGILVLGVCVLVFLPLRNLLQGITPW